MERRFFEGMGDLRVMPRANQQEPQRLAGYAAVFNSESVDLGGFTERIAKGAFAAATAGDVRALLNHNPDVVLGRTANGTLRLSEDDKGLAFELDLPETQAARDLAVSIERRDITGMSFGFRVKEKGDNWAKIAGRWLRTLLDVELLDVSPVTFPAYPASEVGIRSAGDAAEAVRSLNMAKAEEDRRRRALELRERMLRS